MRAVVCAVAAPLVLTAVAWGRPVAPDFDRAVTAAMAPYYGALVSSARGDAESTQRHLVIFKARWAEAVAAQATAPTALTADPDWPATLARIDAFVARAETLLRAHDLHDAHRQIEGVRLALHALRVRHGLETLDDRLTDYHESMERLVTRASMYNEIVLADADYDELSKDLVRARTLWATLDREAGAVGETAGWRAAAAQSAATQDDLTRLIAARDEPAIARAADAMKNAYLELLDVMSRTPR